VKVPQIASEVNIILNNLHVKIDHVLHVRDVRYFIDFHLQNKFTNNSETPGYKIIVDKKGFVDMNQFRKMFSKKKLSNIKKELEWHRVNHSSC
jgi:hypothetical protein